MLRNKFGKGKSRRSDEAVAQRVKKCKEIVELVFRKARHVTGTAVVRAFLDVDVATVLDRQVVERRDPPIRPEWVPFFRIGVAPYIKAQNLLERGEATVVKIRRRQRHVSQGRHLERAAQVAAVGE